MARSKKALSLILAVVMVFSVFAIATFAEDAGNATFTLSTDVADGASVEAGDTVTVTVKLKTDYYVGPTSFKVAYDDATFSYVSGEVANIYGTSTNDVDRQIITATAGQVQALMVPKTGDSSNAVAPILSEDTTVFTFVLTVKADATDGVKTIAIVPCSDTEPFAIRCAKLSSSDPKTADVTSAGQTFTLVDTTVTVGSAVVATPELIAKDGTTGVVGVAETGEALIDFTGYVYGVDISANPLEYFEATNNGTLELVENDNGVTNGTGAQLQLKDTSGTVIGTYTLIIFGDADGDGDITTLDKTMLDSYILGSLTSLGDEAQLLAMDLAGDSDVTTLDKTVMDSYILGSRNANLVNPYA